MPYTAQLDRFPAYLQQLQMESNGKHVDLGGQPVDYETGPVIWGEPGTDGQHSFYQLIHQGTRPFPATSSASADRLVQSPGTTTCSWPTCSPEAEALAFGKTAETLTDEGSPAQTPFRVSEGNRPTNVLLTDTLSPRTLGSLVALDEHNVFTQ